MSNPEIHAPALPGTEPGGEGVITELQQHPRENEGVLFRVGPIQETKPTYVQGEVHAGGDTVNYTAAFPEEITHDGISLFVPGYGGFKRTSRSLRDAMAKRGKVSISYEPSRKGSGGPVEHLTNPQRLHVETIGAIIDDVAYSPNVRGTPDADSVDHALITLIPHSMGGLAATLYANANPDKIDSIVYIAAAGFGSPTIGQVVSQFPYKIPPSIRHELMPYLQSNEIELHPKNLGRIMRYFLSNPTRTAGEALSCVLVDIRPAVRDLGKLGVSTSYIQFEHDALVPKPETSAVDYSVVLPNMGHLAPQLKADIVADEALRHQTVLAMAA